MTRCRSRTRASSTTPRRAGDKTFKVIKGATHYYQGQPELLKQAVDLCVGWMDKQRLL